VHTLFRYWQEEAIMDQIADEPVRTARDKLKTLGNDDEARRLAFVRERALLDERSLLEDMLSEYDVARGHGFDLSLAGL